MTWLLRRLLGTALAESILGDFEEIAATRYPHSPLRAAVWLSVQTLGVIVSAIGERARTPLHGLALDAGHAVRMYRRSPGFTLSAVLAVSLGVGCTTAIFTVVNALLVRSLPYQDAHRLVRIE